MRVSYQDKVLHESIQFIAIGLGETAIHLEHDKENLDIIFDFRKVDTPARDIRYEVINEYTIKIICENWNEIFPTTLTEPLEAGTYLSRKLYIIFSVSKIGALGEFRQINLSIYLGQEVLNDQA